MLISKLAKLDRAASGGGEPSARSGSGLRVGGRWDTQSWTSRETRGLIRRLSVLRDSGFVVMIMTGVEV